MATQTMPVSVSAPAQTTYVSSKPSYAPPQSTYTPSQSTYQTAPQHANSVPLPTTASLPGSSLPNHTNKPLSPAQPPTAPSTFTEQMPGPAAYTPGLTTAPVSYAPPAAVTTGTTTAGQDIDLKDAKSSAEFGLREFMSLQRRRYRTDDPSAAGINERLRLQAETVRADLRVLRKGVAALERAAEQHRWRRWLVGGVLATFIPAVRALFRRPKEETETANDTEYAFQKSKTIIGRILDSTSGRGGLATMAFFVFAVLYVFQNEVSLRVARTVVKRLKKLSSKVERGEEDITEQDLKLLQGWRWRVLLWAS